MLSNSRYRCVSSVIILLMPCINSFGLDSPLDIKESLFSHSDVSCADMRVSGRTETSSIPFLVGVICRPFLCANPVCTSFSKMAALVAGVPKPLRSASSVVSFAPAFPTLRRASVEASPAETIADNSVSSVYGFRRLRIFFFKLRRCPCE